MSRSIRAVFSDPIAPSRSNALTPWARSQALSSAPVVGGIDIMLEVDVDLVHTYHFLKAYGL